MTLPLAITGDSFQRALRPLQLRPKSLAVFSRVDKAIDYQAVVVCVVEDVNPALKRSVRVTSEESEIFHHNECFVDILGINLAGLYHRSQDICSALPSRLKVVNQSLLVS